jgi:chromosome segregation ATPase
MTQTFGITISEAAELLGMSTQGVREAALTEVPGHRPRQISRAEVEAWFNKKVLEHEDALQALRAAGQRFAVTSQPATSATPNSSNQDLGSLLAKALDEIGKQREAIERLHEEVLDTHGREAEMRSGLASSETRVLGLQADLRRTNAMIDSLTQGIRRARSDPDFDLDRPLEDES